MKSQFFVLMLLGGGLVFAADLPEWAETAAQAATVAQAPTDAEVWTLMDRTQIELTTRGKWRRTRQVVRLVLKQQGGEDASYYKIDGEEKNTRIEILQGWHRRADGSVEKLDKKNVATVGLSNSNQLTRQTATVAFFQRVNRGDLVAFESQEMESNLFSLTTASIMTDQPIKLRIIELVGEGQGTPQLKAVHLESWGLKHELSPRRIEIHDIPKLRDELLSPDDAMAYPYVVMGFLKDQNDPLTDWNSLARWYTNLFREKAGVRSDRAKSSELGPLEQAARDLAAKLTYRQIYLDASRGWEPLAGAEVERLAYGDCKDLSACMAYKLDQLGLAAYPVLAKIGSELNPDGTMPTTVSAFDHLLLAIPLAHTLGLKAEISVGEQIYLIYDPTNRYTPLGELGGYLADRSLMICTEKGAEWIRIPASAVQESSLRFVMSGALDANNGLQGMFQVEERGNVMGLRTHIIEGNLRDLVWDLRENLDLPGVVDLKLMEHKLDPNGTVNLNFQVTWPSFLLRSAGGLRLPPAITGYRLPRLEDVAMRQQPVWIPKADRTSWHLEIDGFGGMVASLADWNWKDELSHCSWKAVAGAKFVCDFTRERKAARYDLSAREAGLALWEAYRTNYDAFIVGATCFYKQ